MPKNILDSRPNASPERCISERLHNLSTFPSAFIEGIGFDFSSPSFFASLWLAVGDTPLPTKKPPETGGLKMERAMRFELTTSTLARWRSTTELRPRYARLSAFVLRLRSC
tara:strand:- start:31685 stop:32017 length:333 start_codon:yes stop_codon:yes gene_type:complete